MSAKHTFPTYPVTDVPFVAMEANGWCELRWECPKCPGIWCSVRAKEPYAIVYSTLVEEAQKHYYNSHTFDPQEDTRGYV